MWVVNEYVDGRVNPIAFRTTTLPATVGVMQAGEYEFTAAKKETVSVISGVLTVKLPNNDECQIFYPGNNFIIDTQQQFQRKVDIDTAYFCTYE